MFTDQFLVNFYLPDGLWLISCGFIAVVLTYCNRCKFTLCLVVLGLVRTERQPVALYILLHVGSCAHDMCVQPSIIYVFLSVLLMAKQHIILSFCLTNSQILHFFNQSFYGRLLCTKARLYHNSIIISHRFNLSALMCDSHAPIYLSQLYVLL